MISSAMMPGAEWLPFLAQLALKSTLILLVTAMVAAALWRSSAAVRHLVWCVGVAGVLALPLFSAVLPAWTVAVLPANAAAASSPASVPLPAALDAAPFAAETPAAPSISAAVPREARWAWVPRTAVAVAAGGVLAGLLWLALGFWGVARLGRRAQVVRDPEWLRTATDAADRLGLRRPVLLLRARGAVMPATGGLLWPSVVLPDSADQWPADRRHAVLAHELAHVKRFDTLTQALAQVTCVLFWWHPAVWYAAKRLRVERERACDDLVLGSGTRASDYAGHLLEIARTHKGSRLASAALVSMARPSQLESRLLWVLDGARIRSVPSARATLLTVAAALLIVGPLAAMRPVALAGTGGPAPTGLAGTLRSLGVEDADRATDRELMNLAMADASLANVRELMGMDLGPINLKTLVELAIFNVTPEYVREMRALGIGGTDSVRGVVELRIHGISTAYVRELESIGYRDLDRQQLLAMGIHGVTVEHVRELQALGYRDLPAQDLVAMRIHGVTPAYIRELRDAGFRDLTPEGMVEMRIHNVTPQLVRELEALGYRDLSRRQLLDMGIHGVTPAFIREIREAGFRDLTPETLVNMKIHGIGADYVRTRRRGE